MPRSLRSLRAVRALVMGLGRFGGGAGVVRWLVEQGAVVTVTDQAEERDLTDSLATLRELPITCHFGGHDVALLDRADLVVVNPAVDKRRSTFFHQLERRSLDWTTEINLFCERCPATVVGVTGSFGKSTTAAMIARAAQQVRDSTSAPFRRAHLGGNFGGSLLGELSAMRPQDVVVLELSNAQLEDLPRIEWVPHIAVITNLHPHHLDRHGTLEEYVRVKLNILESSSYANKVVLGECDSAVASQVERACGDQTRRLHYVTEPDPPFPLAVPGRHNQLNAACAVAACGLLGIDAVRAREAVCGFTGLPHRLESVATIHGVLFVNDSKSTSPACTVTALRALNRPVILLAGGQRKTVDLLEWVAIARRLCRLVVCFGESGPVFAAALEEGSSSGSRPAVAITHDLSAACQTALEQARSGDLVLLSPGAPSFDAYANFVARGESFVQWVGAHHCASVNTKER